MTARCGTPSKLVMRVRSSSPALDKSNMCAHNGVARQEHAQRCWGRDAGILPSPDAGRAVHAWSRRPVALAFPQVTSLVANRLRSRLRIVRAISMLDAVDRD